RNDDQLVVAESPSDNLITCRRTVSSASDAAQYVLMQERHIWLRRKCLELGYRVIDIRKCAGERLLHRLERECCCTKTNGFVHVLEYQFVFTGNLATASAPVAYVMTDHGLQLERNVLDDVCSVSSISQSHDKPTALSDAAAMFNQT